MFVPVCSYLKINVCTYVYVYAFVYVRVCMCMRVCMCRRVYVCVCVCVFMYKFYEKKFPYNQYNYRMMFKLSFFPRKI